MDTFAQMLDEAKATQREAIRSLIAIESGGTVTPPMTREQAVEILMANIRSTQGVIDRLEPR